MTVTELLLLLVFGLSMMVIALAAHIISDRFAGEPDMGADKRIPSQAIFDIALKAAAEIADAEMKEAERMAAGCEENSRSYARASSRALTAICIKQKILALTSEGVKE